MKVVQRQRGDDQEAFRLALGELRLLQLSVESWKLLSSRVQAKLDDQEVARFVNALRVYATKDRVNEYNHYHLDRLSRPVIQVMAKNVGPGADGMKMKMRDQELRKRQVLTQNPYMSHNTKNGHGNGSVRR